MNKMGRRPTEAAALRVRVRFVCMGRRRTGMMLDWIIEYDTSRMWAVAGRHIMGTNCTMKEMLFFSVCQLHSGHSELAGCWGAPIACLAAQIERKRRNGIFRPAGHCQPWLPPPCFSTHAGRSPAGQIQSAPPCPTYRSKKKYSTEAKQRKQPGLLQDDGGSWQSQGEQ